MDLIRKIFRFTIPSWHCLLLSFIYISGCATSSLPTPQPSSPLISSLPPISSNNTSLEQKVLPTSVQASPPAPTTQLNISSTNCQEGGVYQTVCNSLGMSFNLIPAGKATIGASQKEINNWENYASQTERQREVTISKNFYLQTTEVTQKQWWEVMQSWPKDQAPITKHKGDQLPMGDANWDEIQVFINKLNQKQDSKYRLPTEAEWEYAARAGTTTAYACGDDVSCVNSMAWHRGNSGKTFHPVGLKSPNKWGLFDMMGNVEEWTGDWFVEYPKGGIDPTVIPINSYLNVYDPRALKGGSAFQDPIRTRSAYRRSQKPTLSVGYNGFRLVLETENNQ